MTLSVEAQLQADLTEVKNTLNALTNALIGSKFGQGRIPLLESEVKDIDRRVKALERFHLKMAGGYAALLILFEVGMHFWKH